MKFFKFRKIPLAWLLLSRQPLRLLVAIAGISFAGILMFMQLGFRDGLFDASVTVHKLLDADLVLISPRSKSSISMSGFPKRRLIQTLAQEEVLSIAPVNLNYLLWRNPDNLRTRSIFMLLVRMVIVKVLPSVGLRHMTCYLIGYELVLYLKMTIRSLCIPYDNCMSYFISRLVFLLLLITTIIRFIQMNYLNMKH